ncbi:hypothetical protein DM02DRAFT_567701 [Periconia macrospinosa]|uniref:Restriction endonuclease n=1 Tax=Periconia macrospinosa TaxID=97972 RepID=A0A2V1DK29_9PLEO|nr:hypothetical protein DM02DRAFT_567701 [Periconia macrospinosa]
MSTTHKSVDSDEEITPPSSVTTTLTPPPSDEKKFLQVQCVISLFKRIYDGHYELGPWTEFQLAQGDFDEIQRRLRKDEDLAAFVEHKRRYDYFHGSQCLVIRMPSTLHEHFSRRVERALIEQIDSIGKGDGEAASFARKVEAGGCERLFFPDGSIHEPDASYGHEDTDYPGVIIEVSYSQKRKALSRLAYDYIIGSKTGIRVVIGLDIEYGPKRSPQATLSMWRHRRHQTADGAEHRVDQTIVDQLFRDAQGNPAPNPGLTLRLSDFACKKLSEKLLPNEDPEITISCSQLCECLAVAERKVQKRQKNLLWNPDDFPAGERIPARSETPPEELTRDDEAKVVALEEREEQARDEKDPDYESGR